MPFRPLFHLSLKVLFPFKYFPEMLPRTVWILVCLTLMLLLVVGLAQARDSDNDGIPDDG